MRGVTVSEVIRIASSVDGEPVALADGQRSAGAQHSANSAEPVADDRSQEVDLELDGQHLHVGVGHRQRCIPAGRVYQRHGHAGVQIAVLLAQCFTRDNLDMHLTALDHGQLGAERFHEPLSLEARTDIRRDVACCQLSGLHSVMLPSLAPSCRGRQRVLPVAAFSGGADRG